MRVLLITPKPSSIGGIARWTEAFLEYSIDKFDTVVVDNSLLVSKKSKILNFFSQVKRTATIMSNLFWGIKGNKIDVAHLNTSCARLGVIRDYFCAVKLRRSGIPIVLQCHCNIADQLGKSKLSNYFFKRLVHLSDRVLVLNRKSLDFIHLISEGKGEIYPNFIASERVLTHSKPIKDNIMQIVYVGHMYRSKGAFEVLEVAKEFPDIVFKFVGPCEAFLEQVPDIPANARFTGSKSPSEVMEILDESDAFILLSHSEGFSNAMLEAMARGLPVIATNVGAAKDMIEENGGMIVEVDNPSDSVRAIELISPKSTREQMSIWNLQKVEREYISEVVLGRLEGVYRSI